MEMYYAKVKFRSTDTRIADTQIKTYPINSLGPNIRFFSLYIFKKSFLLLKVLQIFLFPPH